MQLGLRPFAAAGVAVVGAGLIYVMPVAAPHIERRVVELAAAGNTIDLVNPIDAMVSNLGGLSGELSGVLPTLSDLSGTFADGASSLAALDSPDYLLLDPAFWQDFWYGLLDPSSGSSAWLMLTGAIEQLPVIGPLLEGFGLFVVFPVSLLLAYGWSLISEALGIQPYAAAAEGLGTGLQGVYDAALAGVIDPALPAGVSTALGDITPLFSDAAGMLDPTALVQDVSTAWDPSVLTSVFDLNPIADIGPALDPAAIADIGPALDPAAIADIGTVVDPAAIADIGTVVDPAGLADMGALLSTSTIPDLGEILTSLIP